MSNLNMIADKKTTEKYTVEKTVAEKNKTNENTMPKAAQSVRAMAEVPISVGDDDTVKPAYAISHDALLARSSATPEIQYRINFRALNKVVPPTDQPRVPFPTPAELGFDLQDYNLVTAFLELDPRDQLVDLNQSDIQAAEHHFQSAYPSEYEQRFEPILETFSQWLVLKGDVERFFVQIHEFIQDVHAINADNIGIVGDLLIPPDHPPADDPTFDIAEFALLAAGTAVSIVGAFSTPVAIGGELVLFSISAALAIEAATGENEWTPKNPETDRVKGLIKVRSRLVEVFQSALKEADSVKENVLGDWDRLNTVSRLDLPHSQERAQALTAMTKTYERFVWHQLLPDQVELRYTNVHSEEITRLKNKDQNIEGLRSVALSKFAQRANTLIARRLAKDPNDPFTVIVARTGRAQLFDRHFKRHWNFVLGRFSYQLFRKPSDGQSAQLLETDVMERLLSTGITRRSLYEDFGLHSNGRPPTKPATNLDPMTDVRYNVYSETATYGAITVDNTPYLISLNRTLGDWFINQWNPEDAATRLVGKGNGGGSILKTFPLRDVTGNVQSHFLTADPSSGGVGIYHLDSKRQPNGQQQVKPHLDWAVTTWHDSTVYTPFEINGETYLLVATPSSGKVWIKRILSRSGQVTVSDAWNTDAWKGSTEYVPLYLAGQTYLLIASPESGNAWIKRVVPQGDKVTLQDVWSVDSWHGSTVYVPLNVPGRALFLVATPTAGLVWIKELVGQGRTLKVEDRWQTDSWKNSTVFKTFEIDRVTYLVVATPADGRVWIKRLTDRGSMMRVEPVWSTQWESGRREFLPMQVQAVDTAEKEDGRGFSTHLLAPAVERGIAKDLLLDTAGLGPDFVLSSTELFELFPNPNLFSERKVSG